MPCAVPACQVVPILASPSYLPPPQNTHIHIVRCPCLPGRAHSCFTLLPPPPKTHTLTLCAVPACQVMNEDLPFLNNSGFSPEFRDFVSSCLHKDPLRRPPAEQLLSHAFILKHQSDPVSLRDFMQCVFDPQEKVRESCEGRGCTEAREACVHVVYVSIYIHC
eukprot:362602-Chlamydomonas_euryale.AAC.3